MRKLLAIKLIVLFWFACTSTLYAAQAIPNKSNLVDRVRLVTA
jgi:hypothetical protein